MRPSLTLLRGLGPFALAFALVGTSSIAARGDSTPPAPVSNGYPVSAYLCETDPGERFVADDRPFPSDCQPAAGIGVTISLEDGTVLGTCTIADDLCLVPNLPTDSGVLLVFTEDVSTVPDGYAPRENPISAGNYGEFRGVSFYNVATDAAVTTGADGSASPAETATDTAGSTAGIYLGDCDQGAFSDPLVQLTPVATPEGETAGVADVGDVETSFSTVLLSMEDLLGEDHAIVVFDQDDPAVPLACGVIGGIVTEDGSLAVGLPLVGDSRYSGVAFLAPDDDATDVTIFLAEDLSAGSTPTT